MAKPYAQEMQRLAETFAWADGADIANLRQALRTAGSFPLLAIGSGGSLTAAHAMASYHRLFAQQLSAVSSPLETLQALDTTVSCWLFSAGGGNVDILAAAKRLILREHRQIGVVCGRADSPLADFCGEHPFVDFILLPPPAGKDGFLATNSLLAFATLTARAYATEFFDEGTWRMVRSLLSSCLDAESTTAVEWKRAVSSLWPRPTTLVLYGPATAIGAIDLESKFTEAALGNVQLADFRNFAHGRHHWLAKRGADSGVLALISDEDRELADRTLRLIPQEIPVARIVVEGSHLGASLGALVAALRITGWAGEARGIDPGRPGVPEFGRKLYNMPLPKKRQSSAQNQLSDRDGMSITRKSGLSIGRLADLGELDRWKERLQLYKDKLYRAQFGGIVLDYDGTIVDTRHRFEPAGEHVVGHLIRLLDAGILIGVATGRGSSVRRDLQRRIPKHHWGNVIIGFYNGAEVATLDRDEIPDATEGVCDLLSGLSADLRGQPDLAQNAEQTDRKFQITLQAKRRLPEGRLWEMAQQVAQSANRADVRVTRSSHSVDVVAPHVTKLNVLARMEETLKAGVILSIGDRGRWPGNDFELLQKGLSLSVDETSADPDSCWNLGAPGQRGVSITLDYLGALNTNGGLAGIDSTAFR